MCDANNDFLLNCLPQKSHSKSNSAGLLAFLINSTGFLEVGDVESILDLVLFPLDPSLRFCLRSFFANVYEFSILMTQLSSTGLFASLPFNGSDAGELKQTEVVPN